MSVQRWRNAEGIGDEMYSLIYWREGLGVVYEGGHFIVESYRDLVRINGVIWSRTCINTIMNFTICNKQVI